MNSIVLVSIFMMIVLFSPFVLSDCGIFYGGNGDKYDLAPLTRYRLDPWYAADVGTRFDYYWNFCTDLESVPRQISQISPTPIVQIDLYTGGPTSVGYLKGYTICETAKGIQVVYTNDIELCKDSAGLANIPRVTSINVQCDPNGDGSKGIVVNETSSPKCRYEIFMKHKAACKI